MENEDKIITRCTNNWDGVIHKMNGKNLCKLLGYPSDPIVARMENKKEAPFISCWAAYDEFCFLHPETMKIIQPIYEQESNAHHLIDSVVLVGHEGKIHSYTADGKPYMYTAKYGPAGSGYVLGEFPSVPKIARVSMQPNPKDGKRYGFIISGINLLDESESLSYHICKRILDRHKEKGKLLVIIEEKFRID